MNNQRQYRSTIKSKPFFYRETRKLTEFYTQGFNEDEIRDQVINQNIFQVKTETRKKEIASTILKRLKTLDDLLLNKIVTADITTSKLIVLYAILKTDRLFCEFMNEVFREKLVIQDPTLEDRDFNAFFEAKRQQSETVAKWKDYTFYKLQQVYVRILFEAGLLSKHNREIQIPLMNPDVLDHIRSTDEQRIINTIVGEGGV
ncbi:DUF1819 family protein [Virgibacillus dakarensis]|uniref:DUF1819 family protein n=1 Tax=Virgibacillus dakarensis TaxID=1917889 RepID=UPI000B44A5A3|nr:DUF1819 family protein [Virgibacillus dakarensis]